MTALSDRVEPRTRILQPQRLDPRDLLVLPLLIAGMLLIYWVVLLIPYAYLDDYFWLENSVRHPLDVFIDQAVQGRPLNGYILPWVFSHAGGLAGLWRVRAATLVEMGALGWMFYLAVRRAGCEMRQAVLLAVLACMVPAMQVYAAWATSVANPLSGILACGAALMCGWAADAPRRRWPGLAAAAGLLLTSATIYQPTAMIFWPVAAVDLFAAPRGRGAVRRFAVYLAVAVVGLAAAFAVFKYGLAHHPQRPSIERAGVTHDPIGKFSWFMHHPLVDSLNLYNMIRPVPPVAMVVAAFLIVGLLRGFAGTRAQRMVSLLIACAIFPLAYLPNLAAEESWASYRTQIGMSWVVLVLAWISLRGLFSSRTVIIVLALVSVCAASLVTYQVGFLIALPQFMEAAQLKQWLDRPDVARAQKIILLQPGATSIYEPLSHSRYDEFGRTSLQADWVPQSEVNLIRRQEDPSLPRIPVELRKDFVGPWTDPLPEGTVVVDMRSAARDR
jgi:hypothetical protein